MPGVFKALEVVSVPGSSSVLYHVPELTSSRVRRKSSLSPKGGSSVVLCISMIAGADREGGGFPL